MQLKRLPLSKVWLYVMSSAIPAWVPTTHAASLYWDGLSTSADADGGEGTWSTAADASNWDSVATAGSDVPWTDDSDAVFGGSGSVITVSGAVSATSLGFTSPGYRLTGGKVTLTGTPVIDVAGNDVTLESDLAGSAAISKTGSGTLTLAGANSISGTFTITEGTVKAGSAAAFGYGGSVATTTVSPGATLDMNGQTVTSEQLVISGSGVGGAGAIVNHRLYSANHFDGLRFLTLAGPATIGGTVRWDMRASIGTGTLYMGGHTLTKTGPNEIHLTNINANLSYPGNIDIHQGSLWLNLQTNLYGNATRSITIRDGAKLGLSNNDIGQRWTTAFEGNTTWQVFEKASRWFGPATLVGATTFDAGTGATMSTSGVISGPGSMTKGGLGTWVLSGLNTYTGGTTVNAGNLMLNVAASGGIGTLRGAVTVNPGGTLTLAKADALGTLEGARVNPLNINGGLVDNISNASNAANVINLAGGVLRSYGGDNVPIAPSYYTMADNAVVNSLPAPTPSHISGRLHLGTGNTGNNSDFHVEAGTDAEDLRIDAAITEAGAGSGITKYGPGLMALNGPCLFTGNTTVQEGSLLLASYGSRLADSPVIVKPGGCFGTTFAGKSLASLTTHPGSSLVLPAQEGDTTTVSGTLDLAGGYIGICPVIGADTPLGTYDLLTVDSIIGTGTPVLDMAGAFGPTRATGTVAVNGNKLQLTLTGTGGDLVWNNASAAAAATGTWNTSLTNFSNGVANDSFHAFDSVTFNDSVAPGHAKTIALGARLAPARLTVDNSDGDYTFSSTGGLAGAGSLVKSGSSRLTLAGPHGYAMTGHITAGGGILDFAGSPISASSLTLSSGAVLNSGAITVGTMDLQSGTINATLISEKPWTKTTPGTATLRGYNKLSAPGTVAEGHLIAGNSVAPDSKGSLGTGPVAISGGATLTISNGGHTPLLPNSFSGSGSLILLGANSSSNAVSSFAVTGDNSSFSGPLTIDSALVKVISGKEIGSGPITLSGRGAILVSDRTMTNAISTSTSGTWEDGIFGAGNFGGNLMLGNSTVTGPITVAGGTSTDVRTVGDGHSVISSPIVESGGPGSVVFSTHELISQNSLTLSGASTYTGTTAIAIDANVILTGSLGATAVKVFGSGTFGGSGSIGQGGSLTFTYASRLGVRTSGGSLTVNGDVDLGPYTILTVDVAHAPVMGGSFPVLQYTGTLSGTSDNLRLEYPERYRKAEFNFSPGLITLDLGSKTLYWRGIGSSTWDIGSSRRWNGTTSSSGERDYFYKGDSVIFDDSGSGLVKSTSPMQPSAVLVNNTSKDYFISALISGSCTLTKNGSGTLHLSGSSHYTGGTIAYAGRLEATSYGLGDGPVTITAGATLAGDATIPGSVTIAGILDPGNPGHTSPSTLSTGPTILTGNYLCQVDEGWSDRLAVTGDLNITGSTLTLDKTSSQSQITYTIATYTGVLTGSFTSVNGMPPGYLLKYDTSGKKIIVTRITYADWAAGFAGLGDSSPDGDPDGDGIPNLIEHVLSGHPGTKDPTVLPTQTINGGDLLFRYKRSDISLYNTIQAVQWSSDLNTWTDIPVTESNSPKVQVGFNDDQPDDVTVTIPRTKQKTFARLKVTPKP